MQDPPHRSESSKPWRDADAFAGANPRFDARANAQRDAHAGGLSISEAGPVANGLSGPSVSLRALFAVVWRRRLLVLATLGCLLLPCLAYCLIAPNQYEASARVALRTTPASALSLEATGPLATASILSAPLQQETLANYLRSEQLAWRVIASLKLYQAAGFNGSFARRFPGFKPGEATQAGGEMSGPGAEDLAAEAYLLDRFRKRLLVETVPRSLVILIRFRSHDAALSAAVVNELIEVYREQDSETHMRATAEESRWLSGQLRGLKVDVDARQKRLSQFQRKHGLLSSTDTLTNGQPAETEHNATLLEIDELGRQLVAATTERMVREAEYHAATEGDPELVLAQNTELQGVDGTPMAVLKTIHAHAGELGLERAQLSAEHGPNFPRVVEIRKELEELTAQRTAQDADLVTWFRTGMQTATDHERLVKQSLEAKTLEGMKLNEAQTEYAVMRQEADSSHDLYMRVQGKVAEAALAAGVESPNISVVDYARPPVKAVAPDLPVYMAITFFIGLWLAVGVALLVESTGREGARAAVAVAGLVLMAATARSQAPTPNLDGLPAGVARLPLTQDTTPTPEAKDAPVLWNGSAAPLGGTPVSAGGEAAGQVGGTLAGVTLAGGTLTMAAPISAGDFIEVTESHTPEFHTSARVAADGTVRLPMVNDVDIAGMDEQEAARVIEKALLTKGMLLHPQVSVLVQVYVGQDVSVLGEVTRPGVYAYTLHHRLLDLLSAASGLSQNAGRLVNVFHRGDQTKPIPVVLDPAGTEQGADHNPELMPGDTVQVSRAGLVYVIGDVVRPGGFPVDPAQGLTVVQALSLAWGPTQNAGATKALLIREQAGGRQLITLNLRKMIRGQDPDQPIYDRDILFVPDSVAKNMWNRTMEAAIQSAIGVTIYAGLVYSQRF